jgi:hypothetical protein
VKPPPRRPRRPRFFTLVFPIVAPTLLNLLSLLLHHPVLQPVVNFCHQKKNYRAVKFDLHLRSKGAQEFRVIQFNDFVSLFFLIPFEEFVTFFSKLLIFEVFHFRVFRFRVFPNNLMQVVQHFDFNFNFNFMQDLVLKFIRQNL